MTEHSEIEQLKADLAKQTKEAERAKEELEQLLYVSSHDLQGPLRMISSYVELIKKSIEKGNTEAAMEFMKFVTDASANLQSLINGLLELSRVAKKGVAQTEVDLNETMKSVLTHLNAIITQNEAVITVPNLPKVHGDSAQLTRLFQNLIENAIKFKSPDRKPEIKISVQTKDNDYLFAVEDNGIAIDEKFYKRIFVIFQRLHTKGEYEGTGLGLALCKKIVELHGGEIWVESTKEKGNTFYFTIKK